MFGIPIFAGMTEPLILISRITQADYDRVARRAAIARGLIIAALAVLGVLLIFWAYLGYQHGDPIWSDHFADSVLGKTLTGTGLIIGPWRFMRKNRKMHRRKPMLEQDVEFRFYSDRFAFKDGDSPQEFYWRDIRSAGLRGPILCIITQDRTIYLVHIGRLTAAERRQIIDGYRRNRAQKQWIKPPQKSA